MGSCTIYPGDIPTVGSIAPIVSSAVQSWGGGGGGATTLVRGACLPSPEGPVVLAWHCLLSLLAVIRVSEQQLERHAGIPGKMLTLTSVAKLMGSGPWGRRSRRRCFGTQQRRWLQFLTLVSP